MATSHTCNGCPACIPELSADYWRERAHKAEHELHAINELAEAYLEQTRLLNTRIRELNTELERLSGELTKFWA